MKRGTQRAHGCGHGFSWLALTLKTNLCPHKDVQAAEELEGINNYSAQNFWSRTFRNPIAEHRFRMEFYQARNGLFRVTCIVFVFLYGVMIVDRLVNGGSLSGARNEIVVYYGPCAVFLAALCFSYTRFYTSHTFGIACFSVGVVSMVFHVLPSYLDVQWSAAAAVAAINATTPPPHAASIEASQGGDLGEHAAWFISKSVAYLVVVALMLPSLPLSVTLWVVLMALYYHKAKLEWEMAFGYDITPLTPNMVLSSLVSIFLLAVADHNRRRHFILGSLLRKSTASRIEQLSREKERLDYERRFAERALEQLGLVNAPVPRPDSAVDHALAGGGTDADGIDIESVVREPNDELPSDSGDEERSVDAARPRVVRMLSAVGGDGGSSYGTCSEIELGLPSIDNVDLAMSEVRPGAATSTAGNALTSQQVLLIVGGFAASSAGTTSVRSGSIPYTCRERDAVLTQTLDSLNLSPSSRANTGAACGVGPRSSDARMAAGRPSLGA